MFVNPEQPGRVRRDAVFSEIWLGPKFVFWRAPDTQTIAPPGSSSNSRSAAAACSRTPAHSAWSRTSASAACIGETDYGSFHLINVAGIHIGTDNLRSDYFFNSLHLDLDVGDYHRFYPTLELNWFHYTSNGLERPFLPFEGRDLANIGASAQDRDILTIAPGFRYKFTDYLQMGFAGRVPDRRHPGFAPVPHRRGPDLAVLVDRFTTRTRRTQRRHEARFLYCLLCVLRALCGELS